MSTIAYLNIPYLYEVKSTKDAPLLYKNVRYVTLGKIATNMNGTKMVRTGKIIYLEPTSDDNNEYMISSDPDKEHIKNKLNSFLNYTGKVYTIKQILQVIKLKDRYKIILDK